MSATDLHSPAQPSSVSPGDAAQADRSTFGPVLLPEGQVLFRLYAPVVQTASLDLLGADGNSHDQPMESQGEGWFALRVPGEAGMQYRYVLPDGTRLADPASHFQPRDVHGPSEVIAHDAYAWRDAGWRGRPWHEFVLYEMHVGTFTPEGTYAAALPHLDHLRDLGVTAIELMCVADFAGNRNWGYDGVFLYAPDSAYGRPEELKSFIDEAHARGLAVVLDVVYNHFGPEGGTVTRLFPQMCSSRHKTPWGQALNFDGEGSRWAREFILQNAAMWIRDYHADGLRLDASHAIIDEGPRHILDELQERVLAAAGDRQVHLILENEVNIAERLVRDERGAPLNYTAQWNHDITHLLAAVMGRTCEERREDDGGETERLGKALALGFVIAAEEAGKTEFECKVPPTAFVGFMQTHDLVGNRIFGDRVHSSVEAQAVRAIAAIYLLLPQVPMLFMGEEWAATTPFPFFCDYHGDLADKVRQGRCDQLSKQDPAPSAEEMRRAPDPQAESTMRSAQLRWSELGEGEHAETLAWYRRILAVRQQQVLPLLAELPGSCGSFRVVAPGAQQVSWTLRGGARLDLDANLCSGESAGFEPREGDVVWQEGEPLPDGRMGPWSICWRVDAG